MICGCEIGDYNSHLICFQVGEKILSNFFPGRIKKQKLVIIYYHLIIKICPTLQIRKLVLLNQPHIITFYNLKLIETV